MPNPCAEKRGTSLHFVVKPKHRKKKRKNALQNLKKEEGRLPFSTWAENWIVAMDNDSWNH